MMRALALATVIAAASLAGCSSYREERVVTGAAVGGATGAIIGGVVADATRPRYRSGRRCYWDREIGERVCRW